jgi:IclR family KDG regulon transcriptional repressor
MSNSPKERKVIGSVQRSIDILNLFDDNTAELGITEIAEALGLHKSTTAGLIYTLEHNGYLQQSPTTRKYRLGLKLVERAFTVLDQINVRDFARPHLEKLIKWCNESINLAISDSGQVVYIERLEGTQALGMRGMVGKRAPMHCTALGKAILSCWPLPEVKRIIAEYGLPAITEHTITDEEQLFEELRKTRERGYAIDYQEYEVGGRCVAAPIFDHTGQPVAAVSISAPLMRFPEDQVPSFGEKVVETAKAISREMGYLPRAY